MDMLSYIKHTEMVRIKAEVEAGMYPDYYPKKQRKEKAPKEDCAKDRLKDVMQELKQLKAQGRGNLSDRDRKRRESLYALKHYYKGIIRTERLQRAA